MLSGKLKPNLGVVDRTEAPSWMDIVKYYRGSDLQNYFTHLLVDNLITRVKSQLENTALTRKLKGFQTFFY